MAMAVLTARAIDMLIVAALMLACLVMACYIIYKAFIETAPASMRKQDRERKA